MKKNKILIIIIAVIIGAGGGFIGGMKYQESKKPAFSSQFGSRQFGGRQQGLRTGNQIQGGGRMSGRQTVGEIINQDDKSITVKLQDGSTKIVLFSDKTTINKAVEAEKNDLKVGERVLIFGAENTDGSVTAQNIQLNPTFGSATGRAPK